MGTLFSSFGSLIRIAIIGAIAYFVYLKTKSVMWTAVALVAGFIFVGNPLAAATTEQRTQYTIDADLKKTASTQKQSYSDFQYVTWANNLEEAMFDVGTTSSTIYDIFKQLKNDTDYMKLQAAFGLRPYTGGIFPNISSVFGLAQGIDLNTWIRNEEGQSVIDELNQIMASKGITYRI